jgi:hypothetical protein
MLRALFSRGSQYIRDLPRPSGFRQGAREKSACFAETASRRLAGTAVLLDLVVNLLAFNEVRETSAFDGRDVDKNVLTAIVGLNKPKPFGAVEPLHGSSRHMRIPCNFAACLIRR